MKKKYGICITSRNENHTIDKSLDSLLNQINNDFEVVVIDSESTDGSFEILQEYEKLGRIKLIRKKSWRGKGRQIAFENSEAEYIISNLDMDEVYDEGLLTLVEYYHQHCEGKILLAAASTEKGLRGLQNVTIGPRSLIERLGGWRNLQMLEDWDLWSRSAKLEKYAWTVFPLIKKVNWEYRRKKTARLRYRYTKYRDTLRLGRRIFSSGEDRGVSQILVYFVAKVSTMFRESYVDHFNETFDCYSTSWFVPFEEASARNDVLGFR